MNPLLLTGFANSINVDGGRLVVSNKIDKTRLEFYPHYIPYDSVIFDNPTGNLTLEAIRWLLAHDITVTVLNWYGAQVGTILPRKPKDGQRRLAQYQAYLDQAKRFKIASAVIDSKVKHSLNLLVELAKYYSEIDKGEIDNLFDKEAKSYQATNIKNLLMYEGRIADYYWRCFGKVVNKVYPDSHFETRKNTSFSYNNNAADPVNCLLNYGFAILEGQVRKTINTIGLDPIIGYLHEPSSSKEPLVYDMQELGRWLVDLSIIQLLETTKLKKSDFIISESYSMRLKPESARLLVDRIRINLNRKVPHKNGKSFTYQNILYDAVYQLTRFIENKKPTQDFSFNIPVVKVDRNDSTVIAERILNMGEKERKQMGISKAGLWYQRNKIRQGRKVRLYKKVLNKLE